MPDLNAWLGDTHALSTWRDDIDRATNTARVIAEQSVSITIDRQGTDLDAQTVRLDPLWQHDELRDTSGQTVDADVLIIGYKSHPSITDTNIRRGDEFFYDDQWYSVTYVIPNVPDRFLAVAKASE